MGGVEIVGYEPLVNDVKELIHKKQYHVLKIMNTETINLYWEIGEEIYQQQEINGWEKSIVKALSKELQNVFLGAKGYSAANLWRMRNFYPSYRDAENSLHWCKKLAGAIISSSPKIAKTICNENFTSGWQSGMVEQNVF